MVPRTLARLEGFDFGFGVEMNMGVIQSVNKQVAVNIDKDPLLVLRVAFGLGPVAIRLLMGGVHSNEHHIRRCFQFRQVQVRFPPALFPTSPLGYPWDRDHISCLLAHGGCS